MLLMVWWDDEGVTQFPSQLPLPPPARQSGRWDRPSRGTAITFPIALVFALLFRPQSIIGIVLLGLVIVPLERLAPLRRQRIARAGLLTDLTHLLVSGVLASALTIGLVVLAAIPRLPLRQLGLQDHLPSWASATLALTVAFVGSYVGHRLTHSVPWLWRFHAVHHSTVHMDWVASGRLHPVDSAFTQTCAILPLVVLGYEAGAFAGITILITVLAVFQHANVRIRIPLLRWIILTPEWHHWHHAADPEGHNTNFGLPIIDKIFGTAYLPKNRRPTGFGIDDPVPASDYVAQLRYPFTAPTRPAQPF